MPKPTIFVPGYPGSHIHDAVTNDRIYLKLLALGNPITRKRILKRLQGPDNLNQDSLRADDPIASTSLFFIDLGKQAQSLYDILGKLGINALRFGWDWRRPVYDAPMQQRLRDWIVDSFNATGEPITVIAHSTGGLAVRYLLEAHRNEPAFLALIDRIISFGVPWAGTLKPFQFMTGRRSFGPVGKFAAQTLVSTTWAAYDLLPPDPTMVDPSQELPKLVVDGTGRHVGPLAATKRGWFRTDLAPRMHPRADASVSELSARTSSLDLGAHSVPVTNVVGWGARTVVKAVITGSGTQQRVGFIAEKGGTTTEGGDATIPRLSAAWLDGPDVDTFHLPVGVDHGGKMNPHLTLWRNPGGKNLLRHLLGDKPFEPFVYGAVDDADFVGGSTVRMRLVALDDTGRLLPDARVRAVELDGPDSPWSSFESARQGRHIIDLPRGLLRPVDSEYRRFRLEFRWTENGVEQRLRRSYFVRR